MDALLGAISLVGLLVFIILAIVGMIRKNGKSKRMLLFALGCFVLFIVALSMDSNTEKVNENVESSVSSDTDQKTTEEVDEESKVEEPVELTPSEELLIKIMSLVEAGKAYDTGSYVKGDIPIGEYAFVSFDGSGQYYSEEDLSGNIIDNENFDSFGYVYVHGVGNITTAGALISIDAFKDLGVTSAIEIFETLNDTSNYKDSGWYKVGVDIEPGTYVIESIGEAYVAVMDGPVGKSEIVDNNNFSGKYSVSVSEGQYLTVSRGSITKQ